MVRLKSFKDPDWQRPVKVFVCKDGTISYCSPGQRKAIRDALPIFTVDNVEQARDLQVTFGRKQYNEHPLMPGAPWYRWTGFTGDVHELAQLTEHCAMWWIRRRHEEAKA